MQKRWSPCDSSLSRPRGVYAITPEDPDTARLVARVEEVLRAGVVWLQYRSKHPDAVFRRQQAKALLCSCRAADVPLIINDDVQLAHDVGADGVHLGVGDGDIAEARVRLGRCAIIGSSCYDDAVRARESVGVGADYVAFGACFPSPTKPLARRAPSSLLSEPLGAGVIRVAIGGITPANAPDVIAAGADMVAVVSGVFEAADPAAAVRAYAACFSR